MVIYLLIIFNIYYIIFKKIARLNITNAVLIINNNNIKKNISS